MIHEHPAASMLRVFLCAVLLMQSLPAVAAADAPETTSSTSSLDQARELIKDGDYDRAIEVLRSSIESLRPNYPALRDAYLLLIKTYVFIGNDLRYKPQGKEASALNYKAARELIAECLSIEELRHTRPEPASEYPPEMLAAFTEVRAAMFGSFRVVGLEPADATVTFDADTLPPIAADTIATGFSAVGDSDIKAGQHVVTITRPGFRTEHEEVMISPGGTLERDYKLAKLRGKAWYAAVATGAALAVAGVIALIPNNDNGGEQPLPGPPGPPTGARRR